jgi:hypothetical protein
MCLCIHVLPGIRDGYIRAAYPVVHVSIKKHNILAYKDSITETKLRHYHTNKHILYITENSNNTKYRKKGQSITSEMNKERHTYAVQWIP